MTLMEEKTLADHDINVRSIRQELQLLEEQLKKHGRNAEPNKGADGRWYLNLGIHQHMSIGVLSAIIKYLD